MHLIGWRMRMRGSVVDSQECRLRPGIPVSLLYLPFPKFLRVPIGGQRTTTIYPRKIITVATTDPQLKVQRLIRVLRCIPPLLVQFRSRISSSNRCCPMLHLPLQLRKIITVAITELKLKALIRVPRCIPRCSCSSGPASPAATGAAQCCTSPSSYAKSSRWLPRTSSSRRSALSGCSDASPRCSCSSGPASPAATGAAQCCTSPSSYAKLSRWLSRSSSSRRLSGCPDASPRCSCSSGPAYPAATSAAQCCTSPSSYARACAPNPRICESPCTFPWPGSAAGAACAVAPSRPLCRATGSAGNTAGAACAVAPSRPLCRATRSISTTGTGNAPSTIRRPSGGEFYAWFKEESSRS
ncbi:hypothetical protein DFJ58DRAFT_2394 [Suillus subalutaceus]|uniref:uncharacterized protein n=1 Tax=Suillus subalutaceus TaxID=48586 RepID=UPI001B862679|nr:uncharacterized protein DFJ58DRAFT_2394 [Suillus subalutaceus]KAG1877668.1 hypothetical protein DFJ58DRAFT_2394 [Suillus subalutaceus]